MREPEQAMSWLRQRYINQKRRWLDGAGDWPLSLSLERPSEQEALQRPAEVSAWSQAWARWIPPSAEVIVLTETVKWSRLGIQTLPSRICFASPAAVAESIGELAPWSRASSRRAALVAQWPSIADSGIGTHFELLATWSDDDFLRLVSLLEWFDTHPRSGLYLRQIPVSGIDSKWIDLQRRGIVSDLLRRIRRQIPVPEGEKLPSDLDFYDRCGLLRPPLPFRVLLLSPELRRAVGNLRDIQAPLDQVRALELVPRRALVVENLETAYCLPDFPQTVAFVGLGNAVSLASTMPWMEDVPVIYWGDIDTHGFTILSRARKVFGDVTSTLMDEITLKTFMNRSIPEPTQSLNADVSHLSAGEATVYRGLLDGTWGQSLRLEQERIDWAYCEQRLKQILT
ncbi:DUF3322 domain-containing protein [Herbaspirillum huttiense]|uniref:DUF3322 domain-containing protein n=1 Tax=Herbaspirillum huttiense TaxID=863372 RepID=UPI0035C6EDDA